MIKKIGVPIVNFLVTSSKIRNLHTLLTGNCASDSDVKILSADKQDSALETIHEADKVNTVTDMLV